VVIVSDNEATMDEDKKLIVSRGYDRVYDFMQQPCGYDWFKHMHQTQRVLVDYMGMALPNQYRQIKLDRWFDLPPGNALKWVALAPFAGYESNPNNDKRLSVVQAEMIVQYLRERHECQVLFLGGNNEPHVGEEMTKCSSNYFEAMKQMLACRALIHTDTGAAWVASAYQHPQLGFYGHRYYGQEYVSAIQPVNPRGIYMDAPTVAELSMNRIYEGIDQLMEATKEPVVVT